METSCQDKTFCKRCGALIPQHEACCVKCEQKILREIEKGHSIKNSTNKDKNCYKFTYRKGGLHAFIHVVYSHEVQKWTLLMKSLFRGRYFEENMQFHRDDEVRAYLRERFNRIYPIYLE